MITERVGTVSNAALAPSNFYQCEVVFIAYDNGRLGGGDFLVVIMDIKC